MKTYTKDNKRKILLALFVAFILSIGILSAQETTIIRDSLDTGPPPLSLSSIPDEIATLPNRLVEIQEELQAKDEIVNNKIIVDEYLVSLTESRSVIITELPSMSFQRLENLIRAWKNYNSKIESMQSVLRSRIREVESIENELGEKLKQWDDARALLKNDNSSEEIKHLIDTATTAISLSIKQTIARSDSLIFYQNKHTKLNVLIDEVVRLLENEQEIFQASYLLIDSDPIWAVSDSSGQVLDLKTHIQSEFTENVAILKTYLKSNRHIVLLQLIFIILLIGGFILISRMWPTEELDPESTRETQAGFVVRHPFFSSLLLSIIISIFFYANRPLVLGEFMVLLLLISVFVLLPGLLDKRIKIPLVVLSVLFIVNVIQDFLPNQSIAERLVFYLQILFTIAILLHALKRIKTHQLKPLAQKIIKTSIKIFVVLMAVAFIANTIGSVKLANYFIGSTIKTITFSVIVITMVIILNSMLILLIKGKKAQSIPAYEQLKLLIDGRIRPLINWGGFILWVYAALNYFRLLRVFQNWIGNLMDVEFLVASVAISIGGIISFFLIVFFTYLIVRFIKSLFKDEWVTKSKMPRGTADSISMLLRYTVVAFGIYLALNALGMDMNKFGFMAGALGVGIGFGLQNVVLNFIAGLILTFERPFYVGDIIEADKYMGKVTEIGVRACKILTWDGSEVIVPNGALITNNVVNWTLTNNKRRLVIPIRTAFDANPKQVIEILKKVAFEHPNTLKNPLPFALFNGYGNSSLDFTLYSWVIFDNSMGTKSDIAIQALEALNKAGISVPLPVQRTMIEDESNEQSKKITN